MTSNNDYLSTTATIFGSQGWSLYTDLTVHESILKYVVPNKKGVKNEWEEQEVKAA